jgi:hypothetical protein
VSDELVPTRARARHARARGLQHIVLVDPHQRSDFTPSLCKVTPTHGWIFNPRDAARECERCARLAERLEEVDAAAREGVQRVGRRVRTGRGVEWSTTVEVRDGLL